MLAGAFEALIGWIALDSGLEAARDFCAPLRRSRSCRGVAAQGQPNPKGSCKNSCKSASVLGQPIALFISSSRSCLLFTSEARPSTIHLVRVTAPAHPRGTTAARNALSRIMDGKSDTRLLISPVSVGNHNDRRNASEAAGAPSTRGSSDQGNASDFSDEESGQQGERA